MRLPVIFGPPAVGKMTVGRAVASRSEFRLFHDHAVLEPLLEVFDFGTPPFRRLLGEFRHRVVEEAAASGVDRRGRRRPYGDDVEAAVRWTERVAEGLPYARGHRMDGRSVRPPVAWTTRPWPRPAPTVHGVNRLTTPRVERWRRGGSIRLRWEAVFW